MVGYKLKSTFRLKLRRFHSQLPVVDDSEVFPEIVSSAEPLLADGAEEPRRLAAAKVQVPLEVLPHGVASAADLADVRSRTQQLGKVPHWKCKKDLLNFLGVWKVEVLILL